MKNQEEQYIKFKCPNCGISLRTKKKNIGKKGTCPKCGNIITIPND